MTTRIKIKKGAGTPSGLTFGELAYDLTNKKLFIGITGGNALLANTDGGVASFNGLTGAVTGVSSIRGLTGAVGITNGTGIGLSVSGQTMTFSNTGVLSIDGGTGAVTNVARTNVNNNFSTAQTIDGSGAYLEIVGGAGDAFTLTPGVGIVVSDSVNYPQTLQFSQTGTTTTVTLPSYTTTLAGLSGNQTFTALNTFNAGISAAGGITFSSAISVNSMNIGRGAGTNSGSVAIGGGAQDVLAKNTTGVENTAVGIGALEENLTGSSNTGVGAYAAQNSYTKSSNTAVGAYSLINAVGSSNTAVGTNSLGSIVGDNNVALGNLAGKYRGTGTSSLTSGTGGIYIGDKSRGSANGTTNQIVIGTNALGLGSNTAVIGATAQTAATIYGLMNLPGGLSAAGGVTFAGTLKGVTASFTGLLSASSGISAAGAAFSSDVYANTGLFTDNIFDNTGIVAINDKTNSRVAIGDYSSNANSTWIYLRDNLSILDLSNPFGVIKLGDPGSIDSDNYIYYDAANAIFSGNFTSSLEGFQTISADSTILENNRRVTTNARSWFL